MLTVAERERPILVEQRELSWFSIREGQKAFVKLSSLVPILPLDFPLNGRIQEFIEQRSRTAMVRYAPPFERSDVEIGEDDTAESLIKTFQRGQEAFGVMVEQWLPLTRKIARKIVRRLGLDIHNNPILEFDDLTAAGAEGLMEAVAQYDLARGIAFATRAYPSITGRIIDELRKNAGVSRRAQDFRRQVEEVLDRFEATHERTPTVEELCAATGLTEEQVNTGLFYLKIFVISLNKPFIFDDGGEGLTLEDLLQQEDQEEVTELTVTRWKHSLFVAAIAQLGPREQQVITLYYFGGLKLEEIGRRWGITGAACSQLHTKAIKKLRASLASSGIRPYDPAAGFVKPRRINNGRLRRQQPLREENSGKA